MRPKPSRPEAVERLAFHLGFQYKHQRGSHRVYTRSDGRLVVIAFHGGGRDVPIGTLRRIIADMGISVAEFNKEV